MNQANLFDQGKSAVLSPCRQYRYRLDRTVQESGLVFAFFGVNCSTANEELDDQTVKKWIGFTKRNGGKKFIVGNPFAFRSKNVKDLAKADDPVGPDNILFLGQIIKEADVLIPCWGNTAKVPKNLKVYFDELMSLLITSGKPVKVFGFTNAGDPLHPLMLSYKTKLVDL